MAFPLHGELKRCKDMVCHWLKLLVKYLILWQINFLVDSTFYPSKVNEISGLKCL